jgi:hypothetical protein
MPIPDGAHLDDLAFDEFDAVCRFEDSGFRHSVVFVDGKSLSGGFSLHK